MSIDIVGLDETDLKYTLDRLDRQHIQVIADQVRGEIMRLNGQAVEACYAPGDGTQYNLVFARTLLVGASGGGMAGTEPRSIIGRERVFVALVNFRTMTDFNFLDDPYWIAGKLTENKASQVALGELLAAVMGKEDDA